MGKRRSRQQINRQLVVVALGAAIAGGLPAAGVAEQASAPSSPAAGQLDSGASFTCAIVPGGQVRCWGYGAEGELGYPGITTVGASQTPASVGPVDLGPGRTAVAISSGGFHTCAILDDSTVRCWGFGGDGRLGYGNQRNVGDIQSPAAAGAVDLGPGRTAKAISAGGAHTCAILDDGSVRCWGYGSNGQLGYGNQSNLGDNATPGSVGPVNLGTGRSALAISAGESQSCAILDDHSVRCWGFAGNGQLGYGNASDVGVDPVITPASVGPVDLGTGRTAVSISAGDLHTCAILDDRSVRCWGYGGDGRLGYANTSTVGDTPATVPGNLGPVDLGPGRTAAAISAGHRGTCALLDDGTLRCWGYGGDGQLGYGNTHNVGDTQPPGAAGPIDLGAGRTALAISAGGRHTCARLDTGSVRCWGYGANGRLGYCSLANLGDTQTPGSAGPVNLTPGDGGAPCPSSPPGVPPTAGPPARRPPALNSEAARARGFRACLAVVSARSRHDRAPTRHGTARQRTRARRRLVNHLNIGHQQCLMRYRRTPGRVMGLKARTRGQTRIELTFKAPGTNANHPPATHSYLIKQSLHTIRNQRDFDRAQELCNGACRFPVTRVGGTVMLTITQLQPHTTYYYAIAGRDTVTAVPGPRSDTIMAKTA